LLGAAADEVEEEEKKRKKGNAAFISGTYLVCPPHLPSVYLLTTCFPFSTI
jgi:hypothetical protein